MERKNSTEIQVIWIIQRRNNNYGANRNNNFIECKLYQEKRNISLLPSYILRSLNDLKKIFQTPEPRDVIHPCQKVEPEDLEIFG